jgi:hypothetical protein
MPGVRSTKIETERRIFTIQGWIISGVPDYLILKNIQQQFKNADGEYIKRRQAKVLINKAYEDWHAEQDASIEQRRSLRIAELKQDIRNLKDEFKGTPRGMTVVNQIKKEITKLEDLYPARKHIIQGDEEKPLIFTTVEEREKRIQQLLAKIPTDKNFL